MKRIIVKQIKVKCIKCGDTLKVNLESIPNVYTINCHCSKPLCDLIVS